MVDVAPKSNLRIVLDFEAATVKRDAAVKNNFPIGSKKSQTSTVKETEGIFSVF